MHRNEVTNETYASSSKPLTTEEYQEAELITGPDYTLLQREYNGNLRRFFREQMDDRHKQATVDFLARYDQSRLEINRKPYERLSLGANRRGDIFCIMAAEQDQHLVEGVWHNVFSGATRTLTLEEEKSYYDTLDVAYRNKGGAPQKRQFAAVLDDERAVRFVLSGHGNRYEELDENGEATNDYHEQTLSDCRMLRHEIEYDSRRTRQLSNRAINAAL